jgi:hypothetical protein
MTAIRLFMWGYQLHFQSRVSMAAQSLVGLLDKEIGVEVFLLGIQLEPKRDTHPICLQPEDCGFRPDDFSEVIQNAQHFQALDPRGRIICSDPKAQTSATAHVEQKAFIKAILHTLNRYSRNPQVKYYCSSSRKVNGYAVTTVVKLTFPEGGIPYSLPKIHAEEIFAPSPSLLDGVMSLFLHDCTQALHVPKPEEVDGLGSHWTRPEELLRQAGDALLDVPVWAANNEGGLYVLFNACEAISSLRYEGSETNGGILLARQGHPNVQMDLELKVPVAFHEHRAVRKLLELSGSDQKLISNGEAIIGIGRRIGYYDQLEADLFEIRFGEHHSWELRHDGNILTRVEYGVPRLAHRPLNENHFRSDIVRIIPEGVERDVDLIAKLTFAACAAKHGSVLVFHPNARAEAERLAKQATLIKPIHLFPADIESITRIDGAVLIDPVGVCYAIGVILDGMATEDGDRSRGARYNSSVRYIASQPGALAIIVSEDGAACWYPQLRRQLSRSVLKQQCQKLKEVLDQGDDSSTKAYQVINWMHQHAFYLSEEVCLQVNQLHEATTARRQKDGAMHVTRPALHSDPLMNDTYLCD